MAAKKSSDNPHQWPDGSWHSITWKEQTSRTERNKTGGTAGQEIMASAAGAASAPAAAPTGPPAPAQPGIVDPFFTADDLDAINAFSTDLATKLQSIDTGLTNLETDTTYQKTQTDSSAKSSSSSAQDDAISRGIFSSSVKDATLYDIEAQRSLSNKFLDDKLTTARLDAGTNKKILGDAKVKFDENMLTRKGVNAQGVNDQNSSAWATAQAAWAEANPQLANPSSAAAPAAAPAASSAKAPPKGKPANTLFAPTPTNSGHGTPSTTNPNQASGTGSIKPRTKTTHVVYGNTP